MKKIRILFYLCASISTQCMENTVIAKPKTVQELQNNWKILKQGLDKDQFFWHLGVYSPCHKDCFLSCTYYEYLHEKPYSYLLSILKDKSIKKEASTTINRRLLITEEKIFRAYNINKLHELNQYDLIKFKKTRSKNHYSPLGTAILAEKVSYSQKKEFLRKLLALGFESTPQDKELEFTEKWNRCEKIRQNIYLLYCALAYDKEWLLLGFPQDTLKYISYYMFETEDSLFRKPVKKDNDIGKLIIEEF